MADNDASQHQLAREPNWTGWFSAHAPRFFLYARQQCGHAHEAEDVFQDALVRVWKIQRGRFPPDPFLLFQVIRRVAVDYARRRNRRQAREGRSEVMPVDDPQWFGVQGMERAESYDTLRSAIRELPVEQQEALVLKLWGELTFEQISELTGTSANTAASRYRYALQNLRKRMPQE